MTRCGRSSTTGSARRARSPTSRVTRGRTPARSTRTSRSRSRWRRSIASKSRGRDSAGLHLMVHEPALDLDAPAVSAELTQRADDPLFRSGSVRRAADRTLSFVYKAAAEIGELGDNTAVLRDAIRADALLRRAVSGDATITVVLGHTRWASVGVISEANAHPLNQEEPGRVGALRGRCAQRRRRQLSRPPRARRAAPLHRDHHRHPGDPRARVAPPRTRTRRRCRLRTGTDFKLRRCVPAHGARARGIARHRRAGRGAIPARSCSRCGGVVKPSTWGWPRTRTSSPASRTGSSRRPIATCGSTARRRPTPTRASATRGQIVRLDADQRGFASKASCAPRSMAPRSRSTTDEVVEAEITTRDIDRGAYPHFLLKEISEAPGSFRKTLRGRIVEVDGAPAVSRSVPTCCPPTCWRACATVASPAWSRSVRALPRSRARAPRRRSSAWWASRLRTEAMAATELSGFGLDDDMSNTLDRRDQPERHHHRHQPHGRPRAHARRVGARDREPSQQRSRRQVRRRALHVGRP